MEPEHSGVRTTAVSKAEERMKVDVVKTAVRKSKKKKKGYLWR